jgi:regulator of sigma E protease
MQATSLSAMAIGVAGTAFLIGFAIFIHELGHFLAAKWSGVCVKKFAIGFGPIIWSFEHGGTEYSIRWIPLGGFVALKGMIEGMDEEKTTQAAAPAPAGSEQPALQPTHTTTPAAKEKTSLTEDLDALRNKPAYVRIFVFVAGVTMNFLTAVVLMAFLLWHGFPKMVEPPALLGPIMETSQWYKLGWRSGDRVLKIQNQGVSALSNILVTGASGIEGEISRPLKNWEELQQALQDAVAEHARSSPTKGGTPSTLTLQAVAERKDKRLLLPIPVALLSDEKEATAFLPPLEPCVAAVIPASPAARTRLAKADYTPGEEIRPFPTWDSMETCPIEQDDRIIEIGNTPVSSWQQMTRLIREAKDSTILITVERGAEKKRLRLMADLETSDRDPKARQLGILQGQPRTDKRERMPLARAITEAPGRTVGKALQIVVMTVEVFRNSSSREIRRGTGGPMAIAVMVYKSAKKGLDDYLNLFLVISLILAIMNVLPIPVLDGGYILISLIEAVIRRPIPQSILVPIMTTFMVLFVALFGFIFYNDFMNIVVKY